MILVTAAAGRTGRSLVRALVRRGHQVRAFDIAPQVEELGAEGAAETVVGSLLDPVTVQQACQGVESVVHIGPLFHHREAEMGHSVVAAARDAKVGHFVQFSVTHPQIEMLLNHQAKLAVEQVVIGSRIPFTILQPMHYMQNVDVRTAVADGVWRQPFGLNARLSHVDLEDVTEVAARVVGDPRHHNATYELCGADDLNGHEIAERISEVAGHRVRAEQVPLDLSVSTEPQDSEAEDYRQDALFRLFGHYGRHGITGNPNVLTWLLERPPTSFREYVRRNLD